MTECHYVSFNQDATSVGIGHSTGYSLYALNGPPDLSKKIYEYKEKRDICIIERLFSSSLVVSVSLQDPRKVNVHHYQKNNVICTTIFPNTVLAVKLNRFRVVVCLEDSIHIHNIKDMKQLHVIRDTPPNPNGLVDLSLNDSSIIGYPVLNGSGQVNLFDGNNLTPMKGFNAHDGPIAALRFNSAGTMMATASDKGTVIRVYGVPSGNRMYEFTRGMSRCVNIYSLAFSGDSTYLCSSSNTETVHVFKLTKQEEQSAESRQQEHGGYMDMLWNYLPTVRSKSVATCRLPAVGTRSCVALKIINNQLHILVATNEGFLFIYLFDPESPECSLVRQFRLGPDGEADSNAARQMLLDANEERRGSKTSLNSTGTAGPSPPAEPPTEKPKTAAETAKKSKSKQRNSKSGSERDFDADDMDDYPPLTHKTD
ncbi:hypothetical protein L596_013788 [Steinernema carpocapsae]|uniref:WD repeat domain phosphoinositide-interacting protein 2 n=1 Tax=Steinernema carpocapsae TaxID=34508 RepID=A0A4U5P227_STECR|nr:hypothetical protein L596_013788 [Steinernema carpocapsae]